MDLQTSFRSVDAVTGQVYGEPIRTTSLEDLQKACLQAAQAFPAYRATSSARRAAVLRRIGQEISDLGEELIRVAARETGLPTLRLEGELARTIGQLDLFAEVVEAQRWLDLRVDTALPDRAPLPRPDVRSQRLPLGPVAVFGASNFPLALSTAGGDTASALAAGCPVVVKGHPAHPATGSLVAGAIQRAMAAEAMPQGVFSHLVGPGRELGQALVRDPRIAAVGFTGSRTGGLALTALAQSRPVPIPVYAEMSSVNPVLLLPAALRERGQSLATGFVGSLTLGAGQFCTNPGLLLAIQDESLDAFIATVTKVVRHTQPQTMLTSDIQSAFQHGLDRLDNHDGVELVGIGDGGGRLSRTAVFTASAEAFLASADLAEEVFGPASLLVRCRDEEELRAVLTSLEGQLTITLQMAPADHALAASLLPLLEARSGRLLCNGWPTGVEVCHAMVHGGPFPATADGRTTSVGSQAIDRFTRPVCYQNFPQELLDPSLRDGSSAPRLLNGRSTGAFSGGDTFKDIEI